MISLFLIWLGKVETILVAMLWHVSITLLLGLCILADWSQLIKIVHPLSLLIIVWDLCTPFNMTQSTFSIHQALLDINCPRRLLSLCWWQETVVSFQCFSISGVEMVSLHESYWSKQKAALTFIIGISIEICQVWTEVISKAGCEESILNFVVVSD